MTLQIVKKDHRFYNYARPHYNVFQGSANLGSFWFANGTIYAYASNQELPTGSDIGLMETKDAAKWVSDKYYKIKLEGE